MARQVSIPNTRGRSSEISRVQRGRWAEQAAVVYLQAQGMTLLERNYRIRTGEIDIIMTNGALLIFVEVRYRAKWEYGAAVETIDARKQARILNTARHYLLTHSGRGKEPPCRCDVVIVSGSETNVQCEWIVNAF